MAANSTKREMDYQLAAGFPVHTCLEKNYNLLAIDLRKQETLDADPKAMQQFNFTRNLERAGNKPIFLINGEVKNNSKLLTRNCIVDVF